MKELIKAGCNVLVTEDIINSTTNDMYNIDSNGHMESMCGKVFKVQSRSEISVSLRHKGAGRSYTFHISDVQYVPKKLSPIPEPILFDTVLLI
jgi:hypothetical protein